METVSYTAVRANLAKKMQQVCESHAPIVITRSHAKPVVMLSLEDYESIEETKYLLQSPVNAMRINEAIDEVEEMIARRKQ